MGRHRNRVWVFFKRERMTPNQFLRSIDPVSYEVSSKSRWQKLVAWEMVKAPTIKSLHGYKFTFLAESEDKAMLETMRKLMED